MRDLWVGTFRSLRAHALRFGLTSIGILWGAFMLTFLSGTLAGLDLHFTRELEEIGPKVVLVFPGVVLKDRVGERGARPVELEREDVDRLARLDSVELVSPNLVFSSEIVRRGPRTKLLPVQGVGVASQEIRNFELAAGRFLSPLDIARKRRVAVLGSEAATRLFGREPPLGKFFQIQSESFRVVGVTEAKGDQLVNISGKDDLAVLIPHTTAQRRFLHSDKIPQVSFAPRTREGTDEAIRHTRQVLGLYHEFDPGVDTALSFFNVYEVIQMVAKLFDGLRIFLFGAGLITLLVGAIGVMNIMLVVVNERTSEIGLRKAVGGTSRAVFVEFLAEAFAVCGLSGLAGTLLGVGFTQLIASLTPPDDPLRSIPVLDPLTVVVMAVALVGVGTLAGVAPALRAARVEPSVALRAS